MPQITTWDRRIYFPSEGRCAEDFFTLRIRRLRPGLNPRTRVPEASTLTPRQPKPLFAIASPLTIVEDSLNLLKPTGYLLQQQNEQDRQCRHKRNIQARSCNSCYREKATSITFSECVFVALVIQHGGNGI